MIDLESDPPPDVVVEIDITRHSPSKFSIYAALGVPEIWRYDGTRAWMYELDGTAYAVRAGSRFFPGFTSGLLLEYLELAKTAGQTAALRAFRQRIRRRSSVAGRCRLVPVSRTAEAGEKAAALCRSRSYRFTLEPPVQSDRSR